MFAEMEKILDRMQRESRFVPKEIVFCNVISFYGRARLSRSAVRIFHMISSFRCQRTIRSFNSLIHALFCCRDFTAIEDFCRDMEKYDVLPDACTYNIVINVCCVLGLPKLAWDLFDEMLSRGFQPSGATFGPLISFLCSNSMLEEAFKLKEDMRMHNLTPNAFIYTSLIKGLCKKGELDYALRIKELMVLDDGVQLDAAVYSTIIKGLFDAGRKEEVVGLLEEMKARKLEPNTVCYNAMIAGFCDEKDFTAAFSVLSEMARKGTKPDVVSYNSILSGLCLLRKYEDARELLEDMPKRGCLPDVVSYRILFDGLCEGGRWKKAVYLLEEMVLKGYRPRVESLSKVVEGLCESGYDDSFLSFLFAAVRGNCTFSGMWNALVQRACREFEMGDTCRLVDLLGGGRLVHPSHHFFLSSKKKIC